ncbi:MAG: hypothetical protein IJU20_07505 [Clostridia bacterium]|nr:hypothetical protein [Clostridia bacterium]
MKRILSILLCMAMVLALVGILSGCTEIKMDDEVKGAYLTIFADDTVNDLDPVNAYYDAGVAKIASLVFGTLFRLDSKGRIQNYLANGYTIRETIDPEDESQSTYIMQISIADTMWSDKTPVTADDVIYAWKRLLDYENNFDAACLLFDIKGARAFNDGQAGPDDVGLDAVDDKLLQIEFEGKIDYKAFLYNLTSVCTAPLREDVVQRSNDWAKKSSTMYASGPFKLSKTFLSGFDDTDLNAVTFPNTHYLEASDYKKGIREEDMRSPRNRYENRVMMLVLERNNAFKRNLDEDDLDKYVLPYRIIVLCGLTDAQAQKLYDEGTIDYMSYIPISLRETYREDAKVTDSLSSVSILLNENTVFGEPTEVTDEEGNVTVKEDKLFASAAVRKALSLALDRQALADQIVFASPAVGFVPNGVFNAANPKTTFRAAGEDLIAASANVNEAKSLLTSAGITPENYSFSIAVNPYNEAHMLVANAAMEAWNALGFQVTLNPRGTITNDDYFVYTDSIPSDLLDDLYTEAIHYREFQVAVTDEIATSASAFSVLAPFASGFSGESIDVNNENALEERTHFTGFSNEEYDKLMEDAFAEKDLEKRAALLHQAEKLLADEMPFIPVVFNQNATLQSSKSVSKIQTDYYGNSFYEKVKIKDWRLSYEEDEKVQQEGISTLIG